MTERALWVGAAMLLVGLALLGMGQLHREHYRGRRWQMLEARLAVLEKIVAGDHD